MKKNQLCLFFLLWLICWFFILALSNLGPSKLTEEVLSKKCQENLELKNFTDDDRAKTMKCSFCHKNIHENVKKFTYIGTLIPLDEKKSFNDYVVNGKISSFLKENDNAICKNLLQYTTWENFPGIKENANLYESGYSSLISEKNFTAPLKCYTALNEMYMCETKGLFTSTDNNDRSKAFFIEFNNENLLQNFEPNAYFSFIFERPEYVDFIYIFKGIFCVLTLFFFHFVKKNLSSLRVQDWLSVHKCFFFLMIAQILYNDLLGIINALWIKNENIEIVSEIIELLFYNILMFLWLALFESALKESNRRKIYIFGRMKIMLPFSIFVLSSFLKIILWMNETTDPLANIFEETNLYSNLKIGLYCSCAFYSVYFFILALQHTYLVIKKEEGLTDYKYLCIFSEIIFILLLACLLLTLSLPRNYSAFYNISILSLINLYLFAIYILYSPADYSEVTELRMKEKEEIMKEVYGEEETHEFPEKSIELHDMEDPSNGRNEESKKKAWDQIQKSVESDPDIQDIHKEKDEEDDEKYIYA